jgi:hypothetical protein
MFEPGELVENVKPDCTLASVLIPGKMIINHFRRMPDNTPSIVVATWPTHNEKHSHAHYLVSPVGVGWTWSLYLSVADHT